MYNSGMPSSYAILPSPEKYFRNRVVIRDLSTYATPPHNPVPEIPDLPEAAADVLPGLRGVGIVTSWLINFNDTRHYLSQFHTRFERNHIRSIPDNEFEAAVDSQEIMIGALARRLCAYAGVRPDAGSPYYDYPTI
jgi:hypothetical protein